MGAAPARLRIIFAGTPEFAAVALDALLARGHFPVAVMTQPDRPAGRGRKMQPSPVKQRAIAAGLPVLQPRSLKRSDAHERLAEFQPDLMVVVAYGMILPSRVLAVPAHGCINVHASLLPRWRGAAPIQRALLAGDSETGISIMRMDAGLDTGPVMLTRRTPIRDTDTGGSLHDRLAQLGADALIEALDGIVNGTLNAQPQSRHGVTYAHKLGKDESWMDWSKSAVALWRQVRAFDPWPVAQTRLDGETLRIWRARARAATSDAGPGTIIAAGKDGIDVVAGEGVLRVEEVQRPGGRRISGADLANQRALVGLHLG